MVTLLYSFFKLMRAKIIAVIRYIIVFECGVYSVTQNTSEEPKSWYIYQIYQVIDFLKGMHMTIGRGVAYMCQGISGLYWIGLLFFYLSVLLIFCLIIFTIIEKIKIQRNLLKKLDLWDMAEYQDSPSTTGLQLKTVVKSLNRDNCTLEDLIVIERALQENLKIIQETSSTTPNQWNKSKFFIQGRIVYMRHLIFNYHKIYKNQQNLDLKWAQDIQECLLDLHALKNELKNKSQNEVVEHIKEDHRDPPDSNK